MSGYRVTCNGCGAATFSDEAARLDDAGVIRWLCDRCNPASTSAPGPTSAQIAADGLEQLAAFLREHPDLPVTYAWVTCRLEQLPGEPRDMAIQRYAYHVQQLSPDVELGGYGDFQARRMFGPVSLDVEMSRGVVTGDPARTPWPAEVLAGVPLDKHPQPVGLAA
jgi:hypothetical protein